MASKRETTTAGTTSPNHMNNLKYVLLGTGFVLLIALVLFFGICCRNRWRKRRLRRHSAASKTSKPVLLFTRDICQQQQQQQPILLAKITNLVWRLDKVRSHVLAFRARFDYNKLCSTNFYINSKWLFLYSKCFRITKWNIFSDVFQKKCNP